MTEPFVPSYELVRRVHDIESRYTATRLGVLARLPGNPVGVEVRDIGVGGFLLQARHLPNIHMNRVTGLAEEHVEHLAAFAAAYRDRGAAAAFDIVPGLTPDSVIAELRRLGFSHHGFHASLYARPAPAPPPAPGVTVEMVTADTLDEFLECHCRGWGIPDPEGFKANTRGWLTEPGWRLFLGRLNGVAAGTSVLYVHERAGYCADSAADPAHRGHGVHAALLHRRLEEAGKAGCDMVCALAAFLSTSSRNMVRAGFSMLHTKSIWTSGGQ